jgi:hypothetical protein
LICQGLGRLFIALPQPCPKRLGSDALCVAIRAVFIVSLKQVRVHSVHLLFDNTILSRDTGKINWQYCTKNWLDFLPKLVKILNASRLGGGREAEKAEKKFSA